MGAVLEMFLQFDRLTTFSEHDFSSVSYCVKHLSSDLLDNKNKHLK